MGAASTITLGQAALALVLTFYKIQIYEFNYGSLQPVQLCCCCYYRYLFLSVFSCTPTRCGVIRKVPFDNVQAEQDDDKTAI